MKNEQHYLEQWRKVRGWPPYQVSSYGRVWGYKGPLRQSKKRYMFVHLCSKGRRQQHTVHRLVAKAFIKNPKRKPEVNHKNGNRYNNVVDNLEWVTRKENAQHSVKIGKHPRHERHGRAKLCAEDVLFIRNSNLNMSELARIFHVTQPTVMAAKTGRTWKNLK